MSITEPAATSWQSNSAAHNQTLIQKCSQIAILPQIALRIISLVENEDSTAEELIEIISQDPAIAARLLKLVNSSYYGMSGKISTIKQAVMLLGIATVKNIAIAATLVKQIRGGRITSDFDSVELLTHSITVATCAMMLAPQSAAISADEAFLGGIMHDIGILIEMQACGPDFVRVIQKLAADEQLTFRMAEEELIGASHEAIGLAWCKAMKFPRSLQLAVGYHHRPLALDVEDRQLPAMIHIADVLAASLGLGYTRTVETKSVDPGLLDSLLLTETQLKTVAITLPCAIRALRSLLCD